ncbi:MAG: hypothetical protein AAF191_14210, partial [Verrucomicrobiota bacterium]
TTFLAPATYHRQISLTFGWSDQPAPDVPWYALLNTDRSSDLAWASLENWKPDRAPRDTTMIMAQMAPAWSLTRYQAGDTTVISEALPLLLELLPFSLPTPTWIDIQRWKFAHPSGAKLVCPPRIHQRGLWFAGDALVGKGRVTESIQTGLDVARELRGI